MSTVGFSTQEANNDGCQKDFELEVDEGCRAYPNHESDPCQSNRLSPDTDESRTNPPRESVVDDELRSGEGDPTESLFVHLP